MRQHHLVAALLTTATATCGCHSACGIEVLSSASNPTGTGNVPRLKAQVVRVNCGATTAFSTEVRLVHENGEPFGHSDGTIFSYYHGAPGVLVTWQDQDHLLIDCPDCNEKSSVMWQVSKANRITVAYKQRLLNGGSL